jgi:hypothetical protein
VPRITARALNRATLDRQLLLRHAHLTVPQALERLVGLQAQTPQTWYVGLWTRLAAYTPEPTSRLLADGTVVRMALMRSTIHLVTAADCRWLRPLVQPVIERSTMGAFGRHLTGLDRAELASTARELLAARPLTFSDLGRALAQRWPDRDPAAMAQAARAWVPLVQVPPRSVLVDGHVVATWKHAVNRGAATLTVRPFRTLTTAEHEQLNDEGAGLLTFLAPDTTARDIVVTPPQPG